MATITIKLDDEKYKELIKLAKKEGYENINEFLKNKIELSILKRKKLTESFYKGASKRADVKHLNRENLYDKLY